MRKIRPISRRWSTSKGFDDHYHVEGPDPKAYTFYKYNFFLKKIRPIPRRWSTSKGELEYQFKRRQTQRECLFKKEVEWSQVKTCPCGPLFSFSNFSNYVLMIKKMVWCDECMNAWMHKTRTFPSFHFLIFIFTLYFFWPPRHPLGASMHLANIPVMFSWHKYTFLPNIFNYQLSMTLLQHIYENPNDIFFIK